MIPVEKVPQERKTEESATERIFNGHHSGVKSWGTLWRATQRRGSGGKNVIFSKNCPYNQSKNSDPLIISI